ncbi:protein-tyrosine phosphatase-like protein [Russula vinacea]|nr:protein-tyrosine phosphatase-like protein [Russula vinacea]
MALAPINSCACLDPARPHCLASPRLARFGLIAHRTGSPYTLILRMRAVRISSATQYIYRLPKPVPGLSLEKQPFAPLAPRRSPEPNSKLLLTRNQVCVMTLVERHSHRPHHPTMPYKYTPKRPRAQTLVLAVPTRPPPPPSAPITPHPSSYSHVQHQPYSQPQTAGPNSAYPGSAPGSIAPSSSLSSSPSHNHDHISEILPRLYISDLQTAEDAALLSSLGITHVLSAMPGHVALPPTVTAHAAQVPLHDAPFAELAAHLPRTTRYISRALHSSPNARVLVHCAMGTSRSVAVVCGYLIAIHGFQPSQALEFVRARRAAAAPNRGFIDQLHEYHRSLASSGGVVHT